MMAAPSRAGIWVIGALSALILFIASSPPANGVGGAAGLHLAEAAKIAIIRGYSVAPALMLGLGLGIGLPLLTLFSRASRVVRLPADATRRYKAGRDDDFEAEIACEPVVARGNPFIEIEAGKAVMRCPIPRDMLRIGREEDNDIRIPSGAVHRYHAAIHREDYDTWHITDLSGVKSNGLIVNGRRCCEARLSDGDLIQLGPGKLRFHVGLP
jgi:pSer/pThr/pTyr-binding forkhead associated (FHA) protein